MVADLHTGQVPSRNNEVPNNIKIQTNSKLIPYQTKHNQIYGF